MQILRRKHLEMDLVTYCGGARTANFSLGNVLLMLGYTEMKL